MKAEAAATVATRMESLSIASLIERCYVFSFLKTLDAGGLFRMTGRGPLRAGNAAENNSVGWNVSKAGTELETSAFLVQQKDLKDGDDSIGIWSCQPQQSPEYRYFFV